MMASATASALVAIGGVFSPRCHLRRRESWSDDQDINTFAVQRIAEALCEPVQTRLRCAIDKV